MARWIVERIGQLLITIFAVATLSFALIRLLPGGPMDYLKAQFIQDTNRDLSMERVNRLVEVYVRVNPEKPLFDQYVSYMTSLVTGDMGVSLFYKDPVASILAEALPWTVFVMSIAIFIQFILGCFLGVAMAYHEGSKFDLGSTVISMFFNSVPYYVAGIILVYLLGYQWGWFPRGGRIGSSTPGLNPSFIVDATYHAALPIFSLVLTGFGGWAISMRGNSIRVLGEEYLRVAQLRGLPPSRIEALYVGRNAILPMYTGLLIAIGFVFGGSIILEEIFQYPGIGYYMFQAINARDYPLMMGAFLIITVAVAIGIFIADLTYGMIDPRARSENREAY